MSGFYFYLYLFFYEVQPPSFRFMLYLSQVLCSFDGRDHFEIGFVVDERVVVSHAMRGQYKDENSAFGNARCDKWAFSYSPKLF